MEGVFIRRGTSPVAWRSSSDPGGSGTGFGPRPHELDGLGASIHGAEMLFYAPRRAWEGELGALGQRRRVSVDFGHGQRRFGARSATRQAQQLGESIDVPVVFLFASSHGVSVARRQTVASQLCFSACYFSYPS